MLKTTTIQGLTFESYVMKPLYTFTHCHFGIKCKKKHSKSILDKTVIYTFLRIE